MSIETEQLTPAEHYREAQRLAALVVEDQEDGSPAGDVLSDGDKTNEMWIANTIALAQVHAVLALGRPEPAPDERPVRQQWDPGPQPSEYGDERTAPPTP